MIIAKLMQESMTSTAYAAISGDPSRMSHKDRSIFILGGIGKVAGGASDPISQIDGYGRNLGNLAFQTAISQHLDCQRAIDRKATAEEIAQMGELAVIPAANHLASHVRLGGFSRRLEKSRVACTMIGLGAQNADTETIPEIPDGTMRLVRVIAEQAPSRHPNIAVRGEYSKRVLAHYGLGDAAETLGCPSHFLSPDPALGERIHLRTGSNIRIAVNAGTPVFTEHRRTEPGLADLVEETRGSYVIQAPEKSLRLAALDTWGVPLESFSELKDFVRPESTIDAFIRWMNRYARCFFNIRAWMAHYRQHDLVIGTRLHGTILALQAGVPAVCLTHDSRTKEVCKLLKLPHLDLGELPERPSLSEICDLFTFDAAAFDRRRRDLAHRYVEFLRNNSLSPVHWLVRLSNEG